MDLQAIVDEFKQLEEDLKECITHSQAIEAFLGDVDLPLVLVSRLKKAGVLRFFDIEKHENIAVLVLRHNARTVIFYVYIINMRSC